MLLNCWWHYSQRPCPGLAGLCNDTGSNSTMYVHYIGSHMGFTDTGCPTHSPHVAFIASGPSHLHCLSHHPPHHPHTCMDSFFKVSVMPRGKYNMIRHVVKSLVAYRQCMVLGRPIRWAIHVNSIAYLIYTNCSIFNSDFMCQI